MEAMIKAKKLTIVDNSILSKTAYEKIKKGEDCDDVIIGEFNSLETFFNNSFTPESLYFKTGASLESVSLSDKEKSSMIRVKVGSKKIPIPATQILIVPVATNQVASSEQIRALGMTPIEEIRQLAKISAQYELVVDAWNLAMTRWTECWKNYGSKCILYRIAETPGKEVSYTSCFYKKDIPEGANFNPLDFLFVFFVTPTVVIDAKLLTPISKKTHLDHLAYGLYHCCSFYSTAEAETTMVIGSTGYLDLSVDYTTEKNKQAADF